MEKLLLDYVYCEDEVENTFRSYSPRFTKNSAVVSFHGRPGLHVVNPYVVRYYITANTREEIDQLTEYFFSNMTITDENGREVLYKNEIGK